VLGPDSERYLQGTLKHRYPVVNILYVCSFCTLRALDHRGQFVFMFTKLDVYVSRMLYRRSSVS
jgi:hypothetical protein